MVGKQQENWWPVGILAPKKLQWRNLWWWWCLSLSVELVGILVLELHWWWRILIEVVIRFGNIWYIASIVDLMLDKTGYQQVAWIAVPQIVWEPVPCKWRSWIGSNDSICRGRRLERDPGVDGILSQINLHCRYWFQLFGV